MGGHSITNESDERLKTNIQAPDVSALDVINKVQLYQFDWIESGKHENIGFIAQQLEAEVDPSIAHADKKTGVYGIAKMDFIPYLVKAVQELYSMVNPVSHPKSAGALAGTPTAAGAAETAKWKPAYTYEEKLQFLEERAKFEAERSKIDEAESVIMPEVE